MKILCVADEQRTAQLCAQALHGFAQDVTFQWANTPGSSLRWLRENPDAAAVIVEGAAQRHGSLFVEGVRSLGLTTPLVFVSSEDRPVLPAAVKATAGAAVVARRSLQTDLKHV